MIIKKNFFQVIFSYILITYLFQILFFKIGYFNNTINTSTKYYLLLFEITVFTLGALFSNLTGIDRSLKSSIKKLKILKSLDNFRPSIILLCLVSSFFFFFNQLGSYRYTGDYVSNNLSISLILNISLKTIIYSYTFLHFYFRLHHNKKYLSNIQIFQIILIQFLSITGVTSSVMLLFSIAAFFFNINKVVLHSLIFSILLVAPLFLIGYYYKWRVENLEQLLDKLNNIEIQNYLNYLSTRLSLTYHSHMNQFNLKMSIFTEFQNFNIIIENISFRLNKIAGNFFSIPRPQYQSINRLNYELISNFEINKTSGTSPGLIPSFKYFFGPFFGAFFSGIYFKVIIEFLFSRIKRNLFVTLIFSLVFFQSIFKSPFQTLLLIDKSFIEIISFLFVIHILNNFETN